jgi:hypothetical protein
MNKDENFAAIAAVFDQVAARFGRVELHDLRELYHLPCMAILASASHVLADNTAFDTMFTTLLERLRGQGFDHSSYRDLAVKTLAPTIALAAMHWTRYRSDGTVLETLGATYTLLQTAGVWRIAVLVGHGPETLPIFN